MEGTGGDIAVVETRWSKAFKMAGKLAKITGMMASFVGAISTGLKLFRDIKDGKTPAIIAFDAIEVCLTLNFYYPLTYVSKCPIHMFTVHFYFLDRCVRYGGNL